MGKINVVDFSGGTNTKTLTGLRQWNYGQILQIKGLDLPSAVEVHFSLRKSGEAIRRIGVTKDGVTEVDIPDSLFRTMATSDYDAYAYIYVSDEESGNTTHEVVMKIKSRPMPENEEDTFAAIMEEVNKIADKKADGLKYEDNLLKLMSGETELARVTITGGSGDSGREIELQKSDSAIQWRYAGDEEWIDLVLLDEINGKDGITPHIGENRNWYIGTEDTGVAAEGKDGNDGRGITSVTIDTKGHMIINYTDDTNTDAGKIVGEDGLDGASGIPVRREMTAEDTAVELQPNILYIFPEMEELTITFAEPEDTTIANEYHFVFTSGATATTLSLPDTVKVPDSFTVETNKVYEISILENCLASQSWAVS